MADKKGEVSGNSVIDGLKIGEISSMVLESVEENASPIDIDVFVPLYANTFPVSILFNELGRRAPELIDISLHDYEWDWSWQDNSKPKDKQINTTPFKSNSDYQVLFATSAEFEKISRAGISFIPVPTTIFNPKYLFIGSKVNCEASHIAAKQLCIFLENQTELDFTPEDTLFGGELCSLSEDHWVYDGMESMLKEVEETLKKTNFVWVTDVPDQAAPIKDLFDDIIGLGVASRSEVRNWTDRSLSDVLNSEYEEGEKDKGPTVKIYLWGGPLAAKALFDIKWCSDLNCQCYKKTLDLYENVDKKLRIPYLRDSNRPTYAFEIPKINTIAQSGKGPVDIGDSQISFKDTCQDRYITYCCIGYRETEKFNDYYNIRIKELEDADDLALGKSELFQRMAYALHHDPILRNLSQFVTEFYERLFLEAQETEDSKLSASEAQWLEAIRLKYDKYCRTKNPVAQFQQFEEFRDCLIRHHEPPKKDYFT